MRFKRTIEEFGVRRDCNDSRDFFFTTDTKILKLGTVPSFTLSQMLLTSQSNATGDCPSFKIFVSFVVNVFIALITLVSQASAQASDVERESREVFSSILSPFCPGRTLEDCPSDKASELKASMREELAKGKSKEDVTSEFLGKYGESFRAAPEYEGFGKIAWLAPVLFFSVGAMVVAIWLLKNRA